MHKGFTGSYVAVCTVAPKKAISDA